MTLRGDEVPDMGAKSIKLLHWAADDLQPSRDVSQQSKKRRRPISFRDVSQLVGPAPQTKKRRIDRTRSPLPMRGSVADATSLVDRVPARILRRRNTSLSFVLTAAGQRVFNCVWEIRAPS